MPLELLSDELEEIELELLNTELDERALELLCAEEELIVDEDDVFELELPLTPVICRSHVP